MRLALLLTEGYANIAAGHTVRDPDSLEVRDERLAKEELERQFRLSRGVDTSAVRKRH